MPVHPQDLPAAGSIESTLRQCATLGMCADADFATSQAATLAAIAARNANIVNGQRADQYALYQSLIAAVKLGFNILGSSVMTGASLATIYAAVDQNWQPGFSAAI